MVNIGLIIINVFIFMHEISLPKDELERLIELFGLIPARYHWIEPVSLTAIAAKYYPLFTSMFLHGGWMHLVGNM